MISHDEKVWWIESAGKRHGPYSPAVLKALAHKGKITAENKIWREGMRAWIPASEAKGLLPIPDLVQAPTLASTTVSPVAQQDQQVAPPVIPATPERHFFKANNTFVVLTHESISSPDFSDSKEEIPWSSISDIASIPAGAKIFLEITLKSVDGNASRIPAKVKLDLTDYDRKTRDAILIEAERCFYQFSCSSDDMTAVCQLTSEREFEQRMGA
jgi:hypothetical protein